MFLREFGLSIHPFGISPRLDFLYKSGAFEESIAHLVYGLDSSEAIILITGAIGTGKTMAVQSFLAHLGDRYQTALVTNTTVDAKELLKLVLEDLGVSLTAGADKSDLLIAFKKYLIASGREGKRIIVVVDEAQNLSREALEEIRLLTNLGQGEEQPVQIVLVGQPELEEALERPDLAQLRQRIRVHYKLSPLSRRELEEYVDHRMSVAGGVAGVFSRGALDRIFELSGGVPRVVNTLCGDALLAAYVAGRNRVEARDLDDQSPVAQVPDAFNASRPRWDQSTATPAAPAPPPGPEMAVRRDKPTNHGATTKAPAAAGVESVAAPAGVAPRSRRAGRGVAWAAAAVITVAVVAALTAAGRLDALWRRVLPGNDNAVVEPARTTSTAAEVDGTGRTIVAVAADSASVVSVGQVQDPTSTAALATGSGPADSDSGEKASPLPAPAVGAGEPRKESASADRMAEQRPAGETETEVPESTHPAQEGEFYIHVSSFRTPEQAGSAARKLTESGLPSSVHRQVIRDVQWYRVYMGPYGTHDAAVHLANRLRDEGTITYYKVIRPGADESQ